VRSLLSKSLIASVDKVSSDYRAKEASTGRYAIDTSIIETVVSQNQLDIFYAIRRPTSDLIDAVMSLRAPAPRFLAVALAQAEVLTTIKRMARMGLEKRRP
jgi:hypothetical protein